MPLLNRLRCCGLRELHGVNEIGPNLDPEEFLKRAFNISNPYNVTGQFGRLEPDALRCGAYVFTQATPRAKYGERLAKYIEKHNLGTVDRLERFKNPNTQRNIYTFLWRLDRKAIVEWWAEVHQPALAPPPVPLGVVLSA